MTDFSEIEYENAGKFLSNEELHPDTRSMLVMEAVWDAINKVT